MPLFVNIRLRNRPRTTKLEHKTFEKVGYYVLWPIRTINALLCSFYKDLIQPKWNHYVLLQNDLPELDHCCFLKTLDLSNLSFRLIIIYRWKLDSFTLPLPLESSKTELRFESYGRLKIAWKSVRTSRRDLYGSRREIWSWPAFFSPN